MIHARQRQGAEVSLDSIIGNGLAMSPYQEAQQEIQRLRDLSDYWHRIAMEWKALAVKADELIQDE